MRLANLELDAFGEGVSGKALAGDGYFKAIKQLYVPLLGRI